MQKIMVEFNVPHKLALLILIFIACGAHFTGTIRAEEPSETIKAQAETIKSLTSRLDAVEKQLTQEKQERDQLRADVDSMRKTNKLTPSSMNWVPMPKTAPTLKPDEVWEFVTVVNIPAYTTAIIPQMCIRIPVKASYVDGKDVITKESDIYGRVPIVDLEPNRELREKYFAPKGTKPGIAAGVWPGWAAQEFDLSSVEAPLASLKVNNYVALWSAPQDKPAELICESALVLMIDSVTPKADANGKQPATGKLAVSFPIECSAKVVEASARGKIRMLLMPTPRKEAAPKPQPQDSSAKSEK